VVAGRRASWTWPKSRSPFLEQMSSFLTPPRTPGHVTPSARRCIQQTPEVLAVRFQTSPAKGKHSLQSRQPISADGGAKDKNIQQAGFPDGHPL
jgi:hypothetical protein